MYRKMVRMGVMLASWSVGSMGNGENGSDVSWLECWVYRKMVRMGVVLASWSVGCTGRW